MKIENVGGACNDLEVKCVMKISYNTPQKSKKVFFFFKVWI